MAMLKGVGCGGGLGRRRSRAFLGVFGYQQRRNPFLKTNQTERAGCEEIGKWSRAHDDEGKRMKKAQGSQRPQAETLLGNGS